jgi:hypothetical protein
MIFHKHDASRLLQYVMLRLIVKGFFSFSFSFSFFSPQVFLVRLPPPNQKRKTEKQKKNGHFLLISIISKIVG